MSVLVTVKVEELELLLAKGLYEQERHVENRFSVSAALTYDRNSIGEHEFVNYESISEIILQQMQSGEKLLENIAANIIAGMRDKWAFAKECKVLIRKINPAFTATSIGAVAVEMTG